MKKNKFKITMPELQKLIKEEYASMAKDASRAEDIKARLKAINEELKTLPETLSEVEASGTKKTKSTGWSGRGGDTKYGEKFEKIGSHLKEDEDFDGDIEIGGAEDDTDSMEAKPEMGYFEMKFAELGKELDDKVGEEETDEADEAEEEIEEAEEMDVESIAEEVEETEVENISEDLEEPIEGSTPAQDSDARFNDYMEKDKHVNESVKVKTTLLSEGFTKERKSKMDAELERMKKLAKI